VPLQHTFIDENELPRIEIELPGETFEAAPQHVRTLLLVGVRGLF
jgi:hypothetical protein